MFTLLINSDLPGLPFIHMSCVAGKLTLRSLSMSYQKKDKRAGPRQPPFWYDTNFKI